MKTKKVPESYLDVDQKLKKIGEKVRNLRREKCKNYEDFALRNNINKVTLNHCERGDSISTRLFLNILQKLDISLEDFFKSL